MKRKHVIIAIAGVAIAAAGAAATAPAGLVGGLFGTPTERVGFMLTHAGGWGIEGGIAYVEAELAITDAQRPQWDALADTVRENVGDYPPALPSPPPAPPPPRPPASSAACSARQRNG